MKCNVTACEADAHPLLWHKTERQYYCPRHARMLNEEARIHNMLPFFDWPSKTDLSIYEALKDVYELGETNGIKDFPRHARAGDIRGDWFPIWEALKKRLKERRAEDELKAQM